MIALRWLWAGLLALALHLQASGQILSEPVRSGQSDRVQLNLTVNGKLHLDPNGTRQEITLQAEAKHNYIEQIQFADPNGNVRTALRFYTEANTKAEVAGIVDETALRSDRRAIIVAIDGLTQTPFSSNGSLTHGELEAVAEHFDSLNLHRLLPGQEQKLGTPWSVSPIALQSACALDGLIKHDVKGKVTAVESEMIHFQIAGTVEGVEDGAEVKSTIDAEGRFNRRQNFIDQLTWKQHDDRKQGPASPAAEIDATLELTRDRLDAVPPEIQTLAKVNAQPTAEKLRLMYVDPNDRFRFEYDRDWHIVGRTPEHVMLRLLKDGVFVAQAAISPWKKVPPGSHSSAVEFKATIEKLPSWTLTKVLDEGNLPNDRNLWIYRIVAEGRTAEQTIGQIFILVADAEGRQATVTLTSTPEQLNQLKGRDAAIATSLRLDKGSQTPE